MTASLRTPFPASEAASLTRLVISPCHDTGGGATHRTADDLHFHDALIERTVRGVEVAVREWEASA